MEFQHSSEQEQNASDNDLKNKTASVTFYPQTRSEKKEGISFRQYGLLDPLDWAEDCQEQLFLQNKFWNRLVEIEHAQRAAYREIVSRDPEVGPFTLKIQEIKNQKEAAIRKRKERRKAARSIKKAGTEDLDRLIRHLAEEIRTLTAQVKQMRVEAQTRMKPLLRQLEAERRMEVKQARRSSGLWWGNYNAVWKSYDRARGRAIKEGVELRFHTFDGTGRFTNQIPGGITVRQLFEGSHSQVSVQPLAEDAYTHPHRGERRRRQRTLLTITVYRREDENGAFRRTLTFPMIMHRPLPEEAIIKEVVVRRLKAGVSFRWSASFMAILPKSKPVQSTAPLFCGLNLGWRRVEDGLRVATLADSENRIERIVLPNIYLQRLDHVDKLKSIIDSAFNEILIWLKSQKELICSKAPPELSARIDTFLLAPRPLAKQLVQLILVWRDHYSGFRPEVWTVLERWRKKDKNLRNEMNNLRDKMLGWRTDFYRNVAKKIVTRYRLIVLNGFNLRGLAASERWDGSANPLHLQARKMRHRAALSDFRKWIELQANKSGSAVFYKQGSPTLTCHTCGHINQPKPDDRIILDLSCENCGMIWDQDDNAAMNLRDSGKDGMGNG